MKNIKKVGIVGAGTMGKRTSYACVINGKKTRLYDVVPGASKKALEAVRSIIEGRVSDGRLPSGTVESAMGHLSVSPTLEACVKDVDIVIENVPENVEIKRKVFAEIGRLAGPEVLIGSNTSSIPGSQLADASGRPDKFFNFNFGSVDCLKVEVMGNPLTAQSTIDIALQFVKEIGLVPILVRREIMGYAGNRVWRAIKKEVLFLISGGYATAEDIDRGWILEWGTSMGPCMVMDACGLDTILNIELNYYKASGDSSDKPPQFFVDMVAQGKLGVKSGEGFYKYPNPAFSRPGWLKGEE